MIRKIKAVNVPNSIDNNNNYAIMIFIAHAESPVADQCVYQTCFTLLLGASARHVYV